MNVREALTYHSIKRDLDRKKWVDLAYKIDLRNSPELKDVEDKDFPQTVLIVPDGQRRFGEDAHLSTPTAYQMGADNLLTQVKALSQDNIPIQTAVAWGFSADNWTRPQEQIDFLMKLMYKTIPKIEEHIEEIGGRFIHLGRKHLRPAEARMYEYYPKLIRSMNVLEERTKSNQGKVIAVAVDFGGFDQDVRTHDEAFSRGTFISPNTHTSLTTEDIWALRDSTGLVRTADLGIRTGERITAERNIGTFHSSDIGWLNGKNTQWVTFEKRFPQLNLQDTARAIRAYANARKMEGA